MAVPYKAAKNNNGLLKKVYRLFSQGLLKVNVEK